MSERREVAFAEMKSKRQSFYQERKRERDSDDVSVVADFENTR